MLPFAVQGYSLVCRQIGTLTNLRATVVTSGLPVIRPEREAPLGHLPYSIGFILVDFLCTSVWIVQSAQRFYTFRIAKIGHATKAISAAVKRLRLEWDVEFLSADSAFHVWLRLSLSPHRGRHQGTGE